MYIALQLTDLQLPDEIKHLSESPVQFNDARSFPSSVASKIDSVNYIPTLLTGE